MIKSLLESYSYTPYEIKDKINEIINIVNQLDSQSPAKRVIEYVVLIDLLGGADNVNRALLANLHMNSYLAREIK